jgi:hypothetical protein
LDTLTLNVEESRVGIVTLSYGNGRSGLGVISDHTDVPHINRLVEHTLKEIEPDTTTNLQGSAGLGWERRPHVDRAGQDSIFISFAFSTRRAAERTLA